MVNDLVIIGIAGIIYILAILIFSLKKFSSATKPFLQKSILFFIFAMLPMVVLIISYEIAYFYMLFVITEFLFTFNLFYNYLKSNLIFIGLAAIFSYMEDVMIIVSIYFSFYITGSIIQSMSGEKKGSLVILSSFILMDISFILQAFYILRMYYPFMLAGIVLFFLSVIIFITPFLKGGRD